jgi:TetR/AcrR family transcriptional regulator, repressor for neighboring sulfatase
MKRSGPRASGAPTPTRARRDPAEARSLILDAAERLFGERGPDAVGLKDVAREAGVSHALVSHYFGTYDGLVDAALERRAEQLRARLIALLAEPSVEVLSGALLERLWDLMASPEAVRLTAWALLSGRADSAEFFPRRVQGMRLITDALEARMRARPARAARPSREDIEFLVTLSFVVTLGYGLGRAATRASLGKRASKDADDDFRARVIELFDLYLSRGRPPR